MDAEVSAAMAEASQHCVDMLHLQARASEIIASVTGAESGIVTSGAAASLLLGTAACMVGLDVAKMERLPRAQGIVRTEVIVPINQRNVYNRSIEAAGATIVQVGLSDRVAGAGVRDVETWEVEAAITEATAAILYLAEPLQRPSLATVVAIARKHAVPVIVDAATQLPPAENLKRFIGEGADLVAISGGKVLRGPQASGILCGRRDLIASAALQMLDHDVMFEAFDPPSTFIDKTKLVGLPRNGVGRSCKVGKEEIIGLLVALQIFVGESDEVRRARWRTIAEQLLLQLADIPCLETTIVPDSYKPGIPGVRITFDETKAGISTLDLINRLAAGTPSIQVDARRAQEHEIVLAPVSLRPNDLALIGRKLRSIMLGK
jgi:L-seryl-tRNA(Ser) seleniumtransferase